MSVADRAEAAQRQQHDEPSQELPEVAAAMPEVADTAESGPPDAPRDADDAAETERATRPIPAVTLEADDADDQDDQDDQDDGDDAATVAALPAIAPGQPRAAQQPVPEDDDDADGDGETVLRPATTTSRHRTLSAAINRQRGNGASASNPPSRSNPPMATPAANALGLGRVAPLASDDSGEVPLQVEIPVVPRPRAAQPTPSPLAAEPIPPAPEGVADEVDEWSVAEQPTVQLTPRVARRHRLDFAEQDEQPVPPPFADDQLAGRGPVRPGRGVPTAPVSPEVPGGFGMPLGRAPVPPSGPRLASPQGRPFPATPPGGVPRSALPDPRMERFQELRRHRVAHEDGDRATSDAIPVADAVRQWWSDMRPGMQRALRYQHEARASGMHPIPAEAAGQQRMARLGDAFGRFAASARELTGRAQAAAAPTLKRLHDQMEHAAHGIVEKIEGGSTIAQQMPFLGPGRVAIFFRQGVSVGQAQRLLAASHARPMRIIPRKHGFLALVQAGREAEVAERLRQHPYVRDVAYVEYDPDEQPAPPTPTPDAASW